MRRFAFILLPVLVLFIASPVLAAPKPQLDRLITAYLRQIWEGNFFLGGKPPKVLWVKTVKEFKNPKNGYYYYQLKARVLRSTGDTNGTMVIFKARRYRDAYAELLSLSPETRWFLEKAFPKSLDNTPFPPVKIRYNYKLSIINPNNGAKVVSTGIKRAQDKKHFIEILSMGLTPGTYELMTDVSVELEDHPLAILKTIYSIYDWYGFLIDIPEGIADWIADEYKQRFRLLGIAKEKFKEILKSGTLTSTSKYRLTVLAKVPKLKGLKPSDAISEVQHRNLRYTLLTQNKCPRNMVQKVMAQNPAPGKRVKAGSTVRIRYCRGTQVPPTPVPTARYGVFLVPDVAFGVLYLGTEEAIRARYPGSFCNGGMNWSTPVRYTQLLGPYTSSEAAGRALCSKLTGRQYRWYDRGCGYGVRYGSSWYSGYDGSITYAIDKYCPTLAWVQ